MSNEKIDKNVQKNADVYVKAYMDIAAAKENAEKVMSRNLNWGFDTSRLKESISQLDQILEKLRGVGKESRLMGDAMSSILKATGYSSILSQTKKETANIDKLINRGARSEAKAIKDVEKAHKDSAKAADDAAKRDVAAQKQVTAALNAVKEKRNELSVASRSAADQDTAQVRAMISVLDIYAAKLQGLQGKYLGRKGALDDVLGSRYNTMMSDANLALQSVGKGNVTPVNLGRTADELDNVRAKITATIGEMRQLGLGINHAMEAAGRGSMTAGGRQAIESMTEQYQKLNAELKSLWMTYRQMQSSGNLVNMLGLGHIANYTGPKTSMSDADWQAEKAKAAHTERVNALIKALERQEKAQARLNRIQQQEAQAQARATAKQNAQYKARQKETESIRKQAEQLVRLRLELLRTQAAQLRGLMKNGKGALAAEQYQATVNALRSVREEMRQLMTMYQQLGSYSTRDLFSAGRGSQNWSPFIANTRDTINATRAVNQLTEAERQFASQISSTTSALGAHGVALRDLQMLASQYLSIWGARNILNNIIETGGLLEQQRLSIGAILGDMDKAEEIFGQIKELALKSPFGVVELDKMSKQLTAYGFQYEELFDWTKRLADISAATGTEVSRLALALGHVRNEGALSGYTLRQFAMANVPLLPMLSESRGVSTSEIRDLVRKKEISDKEVQDVLKKLTDEGGMFYNAQEVMSGALNAKFKNLRDAFDIMYGEIAESGVGDILKDIAVALTSAAKQWKRFGTDLLAVGAAFATVKAITATYTLVIGKTTAATYKSALASKQQEAANLQLAASYRKLTFEELRTIASKGKLTASNIFAMLSTGKLSIEELKRLIALKKIDREEAVIAANRYAREKKMKAGEKARLVDGIKEVAILKRREIAWYQLSLAIQKAAAAMKTAFTTFAPMLAIGAVVDLFTRNKQQKEDAEERGKQQAYSVLKPMKAVNDLYEDLKKNKPKGIKETEEAIENITNALVESGKYSDDVKARMDGITDTTEKYHALLGVLGQVSDEYAEMKDRVEAYLVSANQSGGGLLSDNVEKNIKDLNEDFIEQQVKKARLSDKYGYALKQYLLDYISKSGFNRDDYKDMDWSELYNNVLTGKGRRDFYDKHLPGEGELHDMFKEYRGAIKDANSSWETLKEQVPDYAYRLKLAFQEMHKGTDLSEPTDEQKQEFAKYVRAVLAERDDIAEGVKTMFGNEVIKTIIHVVPEIQMDVDDEDLKERMEQLAANALLGPVWKGILFKKGISGVIKQKDLFTVMKEVDITPETVGSSEQKTMDFINKQKENIAKLEQLKNSNLWSDDLQKSYDESTTALEAAQAIADFFNYKNKKGGGNGKDSLLEAFKNRISLYKKFFSELESAKKIYGEGALDWLKANGFEEVFGWKLSDVTDFNKSLKELTLGLDDSTEARRKFIDEADADAVANSRKKQTEAIKDYVNELTREVKVMRENYDTYEKFYKLTGNAAFSSVVAGVSQNTTNMSSLRGRLGEQDLRGRSLDTVISMSEAEVKKVYGDSSAVYSLWKEIRDEADRIKKEDINELYEATKNLLTIDDKILAVEEEIAELRRKGGKDVQLLAKTNELGNLNNEKFQNSEEYLRFYSAILSMTAAEAEKVGDAIKRNLSDSLSDGTINADKYLKSIKNIDSQLEKIHSQKSFFSNFVSGGYFSAVEGREEKAYDEAASAAIKVQKAEEELKNARLKYAAATTDAEKKAAWAALKRATIQKATAEEALKAAEKYYDKQKKAVLKSKDFTDALSTISAAIGLFVGYVDQFKGYMEDMGEGVEFAPWFEDSLSVLSNVKGGIDKVLKGDIPGGIMEAVFGSISSVIKNHDERLEKQIQKSEQREESLERLISSLENALGRTLGGVYSMKASRETMTNLRNSVTWKDPFIMPNGVNLPWMRDDTLKAVEKAEASLTYYDATYASLLAKRDEAQHQLDLEREKKHSDDQKIADYKETVNEITEEIRYFALDMAKALYDIDLHSWAEQLGDALYEAWQKGEDGVEAFKNKATDIIGELAKTIAATKLIEVALEPLSDVIVSEMDRTSGRLDEQSVTRISTAVSALAESLPGTYNNFMDAFDAGMVSAGLTSMKDDSSSSASSSSVKGVTETVDDILLSYVNAIRLDVSVKRAMMQQVVDCLKGQSDMPEIARAQLENLRIISENTRRNADAADRISSLLSSVAPDGQAIRTRIS